MWHGLVSLIGGLLVILLDHIIEATFLQSRTVMAATKATTSPSFLYKDLLPSQIMSTPKHKKQQLKKVDGTSWLIPSQVIHNRAPSILHASTSAGEQTTTASESSRQPPPPSMPQSIRSRRRMRPKKKKSSPSKNQDEDSFPTTGNLPDPWYRSVSLNHLRLHPQFQALSSHVPLLQELEDVSKFRQESWQWDELHKGRCTTSQAAGALGFLEPIAGQALGVPTSWQRGGMGSYQRLRQPALRTVEEMNKLFIDPEKDCATVDDSSTDDAAESLWQQPSNSSKMVADYLYQPNKEEFARRKTCIRERSGGESLEKSIRFLWGNTQEATSVLTGLNFFAQIDPDMVLHESGMCGAGLDLNQTSEEGGLLIGATPDGVIRYSDGRIEALEVKNHCPFFSNKGRKQRAGGLKRFSIGDRLTHEGGVLPQYVSQLQMEMLCLGPQCQSAVMIRQTATQGAIVLRMKRNETWINEMLHFLTRFQTEFVQAQKPPRTDFFWNNTDNLDEQSRYRRFVNLTSELRNSVQHVATIPNEDIQRDEASAPFFLDNY